MRRLLFFLFILSASSYCHAAAGLSPLINNIPNRTTISLNGSWHFIFEITDKIHEGDNFLVVEVNNARRRDAVPALNTDWWNYGGLTRDVVLLEEPETFIQDYVIQLAKGSSSEIGGWVQVNGSMTA